MQILIKLLADVLAVAEVQGNGPADKEVILRAVGEYADDLIDGFLNEIK
jgi:hypothetical protein